MYKKANSKYLGICSEALPIYDTTMVLCKNISAINKLILLTIERNSM